MDPELPLFKFSGAESANVKDEIFMTHCFFLLLVRLFG